MEQRASIPAIIAPAKGIGFERRSLRRPSAAEDVVDAAMLGAAAIKKPTATRAGRGTRNLPIALGPFF